MGLFEKLGRSAAARQCADCGEAVYAERTECPECGGETVSGRSTDSES